MATQTAYNSRDFSQYLGEFIEVRYPYQVYPISDYTQVTNGVVRNIPFLADANPATPESNVFNTSLFDLVHIDSEPDGIYETYVDVIESGLYMLEYWASVYSNSACHGAFFFAINGNKVIDSQTIGYMASAGYDANFHNNVIVQLTAGDRVELQGWAYPTQTFRINIDATNAVLTEYLQQNTKMRVTKLSDQIATPVLQITSTAQENWNGFAGGAVVAMGSTSGATPPTIQNLAPNLYNPVYADQGAGRWGTTITIKASGLYKLHYDLYAGIQLVNGTGWAFYWRKNGTRIEGTSSVSDVWTGWMSFNKTFYVELAANDVLDIWGYRPSSLPAGYILLGSDGADYCQNTILIEKVK